SKWARGGPRRRPTRQVSLGIEVLERREVPAYFLSPVVFGSGGLFGLSATGRVYESNNGGSNWNAITDANTQATDLVAADGGHVFMLASNNNANPSVYEYMGVPNIWGRLTNPNNCVTALVSTGYYGDLYMLSNTGTFSPFWQSVSVYTQVNLP